MTNKILKAIIKKASENKDEPCLDLSGKISHAKTEAKHIAEKLKWLNTELWHLPHINVLNLKENTLNSESILLVIKLAENHPNLTHISTDENFPNLAQTLKQNEWDLSDDFLKNWLTRKAVHAIQGDRAEELDIIFSTALSEYTAVTETVDAYEAALQKLSDDTKKVNEAFVEIQRLHDNLIYPPLSLRAPEKQSTEWLTPTEAKAEAMRYDLNTNPRKDELTSRKTTQEANKEKAKENLEHPEIIINLVKYLSTHFSLNKTKTDTLRQHLSHSFKLEEAHTNTQGQGLTASHKAEKLFLLNPNRALVRHPCTEHQLLPLLLAFKAKSIKSFKKLLTLGANPAQATDDKKDLLTILYDEDTPKKIYLNQAVLSISAKKPTQQTTPLSIEHRHPGTHAPRYTTRELTLLTEIDQTVRQYLTAGYLTRIHESTHFLLRIPFAIKESFRAIHNHTTRHRTTECARLMSLTQDALRHPSKEPESVAKEIISVAQNGRAAVFTKSKKDHFTQKVLTAAQELTRSIQETKQRIEKGEIAKTNLVTEVEERKEAESKNQATLDKAKRAIAERDERVARENEIVGELDDAYAEIARLNKAHRMKTYSSIFFDYDTLNAAQARHEKRADTYREALQYILYVFTEGSKTERKEVSHWLNIEARLVEAQEAINYFV